MKRVLILLIAAMCCGGCEVNNAPALEEALGIEFYKSKPVAKNVDEVEIEGHKYLVFDGVYKGCIIHAEHCPCKREKDTK